MRLRNVSSWFFPIVLFALGANALLLLLIKQSYDSVVAAQQHRQSALELADELHRETEQLARLVRAYTATGEPRYLLYYYDILAVRQGEKPPPAQFNARSYWDDVIAGRIKHSIPKEGQRRSLADLMRSQGFSDDELVALKGVVDATAAMNRIEQVAFAATQGLYNPETREFVSDGTPRLDFASKLVNGDAYSALKADLSTAVDRLVLMTDRRTRDEAAAAGRALERWILLSLISMAVTIGLVILSMRIILRQVLIPIHRLGEGVDRLGASDYSTRIGRLQGVEELAALGRTFDSMAQAIEDDIGRRHAVQKELEAARKQAEDATHAKSMFLANMSHEIRTPMNAILGMAYLALKTDLTARQHDYVSKIHNAAKSLLGIINDILDFSKVEAGKLELEEGRFRVEDVAGNALSLLRQRAHEKDIELLFDVREAQLLGDGGALMGDALRLGQVLTNLLSNAVKFTHSGYVKLTIVVEARDAESERLRFTVRDTGIGMSDQEVGRLFQEFTQADGSTTRKYGGTGLGLTISKRIVELMGGRIWVESIPGQGSSFIFTARFSLTRPPAPPSPPLPRAESMRVLVIDDQRDARMALADLLGALGVGVATAGCIDQADDGDTALTMNERAERDGHPYDLLLIDWVMPRLDGEGVLKALYSGNRRRVPLPVVVSAYDSEIIHSRAEELGARHFLPKPVLPESLRELVRGLVGGEATSPAESGEAAIDLAGMRVLVVEDNPINQQLAAELLQSRGVAVDVAGNGQEAIDRIIAQPPDHYGVVLMDLQMPVLDGYDATRLLRLDARYLNLPIVAMTAHALAEERERCQVLGMNGHISKPIDPDVLYATLAGFREGSDVSRPGPVTHAAASAAATLSVHEAALPHIAGLDTDAGLRHAGGRPAFYVHLLQRFARDYAGFAADVDSMLASSRWDDAERQAHTLKGLAGSLGATDVKPRAAALESAARARDMAEAQAALASIGASLAPLVAAVDAHYALDDRAEPRVEHRRHSHAVRVDARIAQPVAGRRRRGEELLGIQAARDRRVPAGRCRQADFARARELRLRNGHGPAAGRSGETGSIMSGRRAAWLPRVLAAVLPVPVAAADFSLGTVDFSVSGFGTLGYAVSDQPYTYQRFIDETGTFRRDSLAGLQVDARFAGKFGATVQVKVAPDATNDNRYEVSVPWAFVSFRPANDWLIRVGKQRIPLYLYSETVDVGVTYDFARLPTEMYSIISSNDFTGLSIGKTWAVANGELSLDVFGGKTTADYRFWLRDNVPPIQTSGAFYVSEDVTAGGAVLSYRPGQDTYRIGVNWAKGKLKGGEPLPTSFPFVTLAPGIGYYQVDDSMPGPGGASVESESVTVVTLGAEIGMGGGFRTVGELARTFGPSYDISLASTRGYAALLKTIDKWAPYVMYAFLRSASPPRNFYLAVNYNTVPGFIPGAALINESQRIGADHLLAWDQHSWAVGTSYSLSAASKLKAEVLRARIGQMSGLVDAPSGSNVQHQNITVFSLCYNFVF